MRQFFVDCGRCVRASISLWLQQVDRHPKETELPRQRQMDYARGILIRNGSHHQINWEYLEDGVHESEWRGWNLSNEMSLLTTHLQGMPRPVADLGHRDYFFT